jgi:drug/metabolite transporter (DMT)-like permease
MVLAAAAGFTFSLLNVNLRTLASELPPFQVQFLRYGAGLVVMIPWIVQAGVMAYKPKALGRQLWRGVAHTVALFFWFSALPHIPFATLTAIGFTGPIFVMLGAVLFLKEPMFWQRWAAALMGFGGVLVVVGPQFTGSGGHYALMMLASAPLFAASFLLAKALTRHDTPQVIVAWQSLTVAVFTLPIAIWLWEWPSLLQWGIVMLCGALGSLGHWMLTMAYSISDISAAQPVKFLDLIWAAALGYLVFSEIPTSMTLLGAGVIFLSTSWIARVEARRGRRTAA